MDISEVLDKAQKAPEPEREHPPLPGNPPFVPQRLPAGEHVPEAVLVPPPPGPRCSVCGKSADWVIVLSTSAARIFRQRPVKATGPLAAKLEAAVNSVRPAEIVPYEELHFCLEHQLRYVEERSRRIEEERKAREVPSYNVHEVAEWPDLVIETIDKDWSLCRSSDGREQRVGNFQVPEIKALRDGLGFEYDSLTLAQANDIAARVAIGGRQKAEADQKAAEAAYEAAQAAYAASPDKE